ncbi:MFS transporter [Apiospora sp. TS-2023a]
MSQQSNTPSPIGPGEVEKSHLYDGQGTEENPFVVEFQKDDPSNPMNWSQLRKWFITAIVTMSVFIVTLTSSAYSSSAQERIPEFNISRTVFILGVSLFVLGFAIGPAVWGPLSELYGKKPQWIVSHVAMVAFIGGSAGSKNIETLLVLRLLGGIFGASPLVNSGGAIADLFPPAQRGLAMTLYCVAPFLGPMLGPVVSGFVSDSIGWRWVEGVCCIAIGVTGILGVIFVPETYGPVLLANKAKDLSQYEARYVSVLEKNQGKKKPSEIFQKALIRPWILLFREPIVLVASLYMAVIFGTVYMFMGAMPIVFNQGRGWSKGIGRLSFMGIAAGIIVGLAYVIYDNNNRYMKLSLAKATAAESRLPPAIIGAIALPVGIIHWAVCIVLSSPFGFGCVLVILPVINYLIDSYTIYAASMYNHLGIHWATSIPAFLTLACMPFPFIMYRYGEAVRMKCKYAAEAAEMMRQMHKQQDSAPVPPRLPHM